VVESVEEKEKETKNMEWNHETAKSSDSEQVDEGEEEGGEDEKGSGDKNKGSGFRVQGSGKMVF
jgi:hypothetical protein